MRYTKFFQYVYLVFGALFLYDAVAKYTTDGRIAYPSLLLGAVAIFMFLFRRKFAKKFDAKD
jgi:hypothetical protein